MKSKFLRRRKKKTKTKHLLTYRQQIFSTSQLNLHLMFLIYIQGVQYQVDTRHNSENNLDT